MNELIINKHKGEYKACILEDNCICEFYCSSDVEQNGIGNIYMGRVVNVIDGMQAAFIDIGTGKNAFIALKDVLPKVDISKEVNIISNSKKISSTLKNGDKILVQIKKAPVGDKGPRVSTHITLPGNYIVLMPDTKILTVSQKIEDDFEKERLKEILSKVLPENYGAIIRTDANGISKEQLEMDVNELVNMWNNIQETFKNSIEIGIIHDEHEFLGKLSKERINKKINKVYVNDKDVMKLIECFIKNKNLNNIIKLEIINTDDIFSEFGIEGQILNIQNRKCWLKCGGYIVIDKTEALTAIDVNSGKHLGEGDMEDTAYDVNKEAAYEVMRQIRLKDIGGIIIIDYINLNSREKQEEILNIMTEEAKKDKTKVDIKGYTSLNLVELTRKKVNI